MLKKILVAFLLSSPGAALAAIAPQYVFTNEVQALLQNDACLTVGEPVSESGVVLEIKACDIDKARALAQLLEKSGASVGARVDIFGPNDELVRASLPAKMSPADLAQVFEIALNGNAFYSRTLTRLGMGFQDDVFVEFKPMVAQWFVDNMTDLHGLESAVAADAFREIFGFDQYAKRGVEVRAATARLEP